MSIRSLPATYMRGGTSRALIFQESDLPSQRKEWDEIFLLALGSPDPYGRQLNGMGGGVSSLSKVAVLRPSQRDDADVDYTFAQVSVHQATVDYKGNCGNISSAVGPYAVMKGWVKTSGHEAHVRIFNTNTQKIIHAYFPVKNGEPVFDGELSIPGVAGAAAPIRLEFQEPGGATTGKLLPTGSVHDLLKVAGHGEIPVSMIDAANACVFVHAKEVGLQGDEQPEELDADKSAMGLLDLIRRQASVTMGIAKDLEDAKNFMAIPYIGIVSSALNEDMDFSLRVIASGQPHKALPLTVSLCAAVASKLSGSVISDVLKDKNLHQVRIGMPSGVLTLDAKVEKAGEHWHVLSGSFYRTARPLFEGRVFA
ncbi:MAG: PrpF family protein [Bdellovibrio sp.]|nr:PrpF family protein [Bdellovibrio sp.]